MASLRFVDNENKSRKMPPRLEPASPGKKINLVAPQAWLRRIDAWRRKQEPIPNRSEAIRILVDIALSETKRKSI